MVHLPTLQGHHVTKLAPTWWNDPRMCTHNKDNEWYIYIRYKDTMSQSLPPTWWNDPRMCIHNKYNEWYIYLHNKDTMSQSLPQPGGMTQECALTISIMNLPTLQGHHVTKLAQPGGMTHILLDSFLIEVTSYLEQMKQLS